MSYVGSAVREDLSLSYVGNAMGGDLSLRLRLESERRRIGSHEPKTSGFGRGDAESWLITMTGAETES